MAYTYVGALARKRTIDALWENVDLTNVDVNVMYATYEKVYVTLTNPLYTNPVYLDMDLARPLIPASIPGTTIPAWLATLGNKALPTFNNAPAFATQVVLFRDAWQAGYTIQPTDINASPQSQLPTGSLNDLVLTRPNTDYNYLWQHALISVNGYIHFTGVGQSGLYVESGMYTARKLNNNQVGVLSFEQIGEINCIPITDSMIYNQATVEPYSHFVYVNLGQSLNQKSLLFVLGGRLHAMDESYTVVGDGLVRINMDRIPWAQIFFDAMEGLDISSITWDSTQNNPSQIAVSDLYSNAVIGAFLKLSQTFFVIVDAPELYLKRHYVERTKLPGRWTCAAELQEYPLIGPMGSIIEYTPVWENSRYVLRGRTVYDENHLYDTAPWETEYSIAPSLYSGQPTLYPNAFLMELGYQQLSATPA